ncbi:MAG TPA: hypothetical protein VMX74_00760 [Pirellulales bacterium]|nr:hypothetical protein [Pirellulales bacterium]
MNTNENARLGGTRQFHLWVWRLLLLVLYAGAVLIVEQCAEMWLLPSITAEQALRQMQPDDAAAEALRFSEWARGLIPVVSVASVLIAGLVLFVPSVAGRLRRLVDTHV